MHTQLLDILHSHREEMTRLIEALVSIPSENPPGAAYQECVKCLHDAMSRLGLRPQIERVGIDPDTTGEIVTASHGDGDRTLFFHGHYDVVPAATRDQFVPRRENGALFGRGSSDMKSGLVAMIYAIQALRLAQVPLSGRIRLLCVPDEETGGARGSRQLARSGAWLAGLGLPAPGSRPSTSLGAALTLSSLDRARDDPEVIEGSKGRLPAPLAPLNCVGMLTAEPTSGVVWHASRGAISLRVTVKGRAAHVGLQYQGINAFEHAIEVVNRLRILKAEVEARRTPMNVQPRAAAGSILLIGGRVEAGTNFNVVPDVCRFTIDRRTNPEEDVQMEKRRILDLLEHARADGIDLDVETLQEGDGSLTGIDAPLSTALRQSAADVTGEEPAFELCPGLLETRFYSAAGVPALAYGPGILAVSHGPKEFVKLDRVIDCAAIYALTAAALLRP